jgi:hypothetical protein
MNLWIAFSLGLAAHVLAFIFGRYSEWRFHHAAQLDEEDIYFVEDLKAFGRWLVQTIVGRLPASHRQRWSEEEYNGRPDMLGGWSR